MTWPLISVVIPSRNMGAFIGEAVESVLKQSRPAHEIVVVDDGSTDDTAAILGGFGARVRAVRGPGLGSAISRNLGIMTSTGDYIAFLDADDVWFPDKLECQIESLSTRGPAVEFCYTDYVRGERPDTPSAPVLAEYTRATEGQVFSNLLRENFVLTSSVIVTRRALALSGLMNRNLRGGQDFDLWLRLARCVEFCRVDDPLVFYRRHGESITRSPAYLHYMARLWDEIEHEHRDCSAEDRAYILQRLGDAYYESGLHALRQGDTRLARRQLTQAARNGVSKRKLAKWLAISGLPAAAVRRLYGWKRKAAP